MNILYDRIDEYFSDEQFNVNHKNEFKIIEEIKKLFSNFNITKKCSDYELYVKLKSGDFFFALISLMKPLNILI